MATSTTDSKFQMNLLPPEGNKDVGMEAFVVMSDGLKDKDDRGLIGKWNRSYELRRNRHFKGKSKGFFGSKQLPLLSGNLIYRHMTQTVNALTDNNPTFNVTQVAGREETPDLFDKIHKATQHWWIETEQQQKFIQSVTNGETYGVAVEHPEFDPEAESGIGEVITTIVDPFLFGFYPTTQEDIQKCLACWFIVPTNILEARQKWPKKAKEIMTDADIMQQLGDERKEIASGGGSSSRRDTSIVAQIGSTFKELLRANTDGTSTGTNQEVFVLHMWVKDFTMKKTEIQWEWEQVEAPPVQQPQLPQPEGEGQEQPEQPPTRVLNYVIRENKELIEEGSITDQQGLPDNIKIHISRKELEQIENSKTGKIEIEQPKYPGFIRRIIACNQGKLVLQDDPNPSINPVLPVEKAMKTYLWDKFPFAKTVSITDPADPWGMSDMEQLAQINVQYDKTLSQIALLQSKFSTGLKIINPKDSGVQNQEFTNYPQILRPANQMVSQGIRFLGVPNVAPADMLPIAETYKSLFFLVAGQLDLEGTQKSPNGVIAYQAIAAILEQIARLLRGKLRNYQYLIRERGRMFTSHMMNWYTEDRWLTVDEGGEKKTMRIRGEELIVPAKLSVVNGSTLPVSKVQQREEALTLYRDGVFGKPGTADASQFLLDALEFNGRKNIVEKLRMGEVGQVTARLQALGFPEPLLQYITQVSSVDDKDLEKAIEKGQLPLFQDIIKQLSGQQGQSPQEISQNVDLEGAKAEVEKLKKEIEVMEADKINKLAEAESKRIRAEADRKEQEAQVEERFARAQKELAERDLMFAKIDSERVDQKVKMFGTTLDLETIKINKANAAANIRAQVKNEELKAEEIKVKDKQVSVQKNRPGYNEKGIKSNNAKEGE